MALIAIRGAITVDEDTEEAIGRATEALCRAITEANALPPSAIVSAIFTLTPDLHAAFPAKTARQQGWGDVPMICAQEVAVPGALAKVCRVLLHVESDRAPKHVYLGGARVLRPDLAGS